MRRGLFKHSSDGKTAGLKPLFRELRRWDYLQLAVMILLLAAGVLFIYSTGEQIGTAHAAGFWKKQLVWIAIGLVGFLLAARCDYRPKCRPRR